MALHHPESVADFMEPQDWVPEVPGRFTLHPEQDLCSNSAEGGGGTREMAKQTEAWGTTPGNGVWSQGLALWRELDS